MPPAILSAKRIGEVGVIEQVEEFGPQLHADAFVEVEHLHRREIHIFEAEVAESVTAHCAESAGSRRSHDSPAIDVATPIRELVCRGLASGVSNAGGRTSRRAGRHADDVATRVGQEIGIGDPRNSGGAGGLEVRSRPGEIPAVDAFTGKT